MNPLSILGFGTGLLGSIGKMIGRGNANRQMRSLMAKQPQYQVNPIAQQRLALAQTMLNARMPGAMTAEQNIYKSGANAMSNTERGATDSAQLLSAASGIQGQQNKAFEDLGMQEAGDYQRRYGNLMGAQEGMMREQDKVFEDQLRRYNNQVQMMGGMNENRQNTMGDISSLGFGLASFATQNPDFFGSGKNSMSVQDKFNQLPSIGMNWATNPNLFPKPTLNQ